MKNQPMKFMIRVNSRNMFRPTAVKCTIFKTRTITMSQDSEVSELLNIPLKKYRSFLLEQFNAQIANVDGYKDNGKQTKLPILYFKKIEDAQRALAWIESITVMVNEYLINSF